jgi:hypothetical protein
MIRRNRLLVIAACVGAAVAVTATGSAASTGEPDTRDGQSFIFEQLSGFNEVPTLSTPGHATFRAVINDKAQEITWRLSYADFPTAVTQSHVHLGAMSTNGGISFFLCTNLANAPAGVVVQACPAEPATISGTIKPGDVIGPGTQGISAGEFDKIVRAIRAGVTYANIHTVQFAPGEARAELGHQH